MAGVGEFFAYLAGCTVHDFQLLDLLTSDHQVVAQVVIEVSLPNGGRYRDEELHLWTLGADGRVSALRHYTDTAKHIAAATGQDTTAPGSGARKSLLAQRFPRTARFDVPS